MGYKRFTAVNLARVMEVIEVRAITGAGTSGNPIIEVTEYYTKDGELLARKSVEDELSIGVWENENNN